MESLKLHNSLKPGAPVPFVPIKKGEVSWYACGPTVYDKSHLGHARNYVSTDIIRRILIHYFGFKLNFVMNITDIDDKVKYLWSISAWRKAYHLVDHHQGSTTAIARDRKEQELLPGRARKADTYSFQSLCS